MMHRQLGYSPEDLAQSPYARFYSHVIGPLQPQVVEALLIGPQADELFPPVGATASLIEPGYWPVETGYARPSDGSIRVFCLTQMPGVSPEMWDWWFGWHGCEALRYKLWHPKAHIAARWADGRDDENYIGRTSLITEYLGPRLVKGAIGFVRPAAMGLDEARLAAQGEVAICARVGVPGTALKGGWLLHQLRPVEGGCEMRSRMWMGGENTAIGDHSDPFRRGLARAIRPLAAGLLPAPADLLIHNAQEMAHLAGFLPDLFKTFGAAYRERQA